MTELLDIQEGRKGEWMATASGGRFYPEDPREEDITVEDIANGLALDCRYGGQGRVDRYYSVAEHSWHMAAYAANHGNYDAAIVALLHDAPEAFLNDLPRAVKHAVGEGYARLEDQLEHVIFKKFGLLKELEEQRDYVKTLDRRMVPHEKIAVMAFPQAWAFDAYDPLEGIVIRCWSPVQAKRKWLRMFIDIMNHVFSLKERAA